MVNLYDLLGVAEDAPSEEIKKRFRLLAKQYHPDIAGGDDKQFRELTHAYKILSNTAARNDYDKTIKNFRSQTGSFSEYRKDRYTVEGKHLKKFIQEIIRYGHFTYLTVRYKEKRLLTLSYPMAVAFAVIGLIKAPVAFLLLHLGTGALFTVEVNNRLMALFEEALSCHNKGNILSAEEYYKAILKRSEYFIPARINLGLLYRQRGERKKAVHCFRKVLDAVPFGEIGEMARKQLEELQGFYPG
jgi:tetratricopeptide (TPR) repeat protein